MSVCKNMINPKKILLFIDCLGAGGAQRQLVGLAVMLKNHGYDVKVATYFDIDFYQDQLTYAGVKNDVITGAADTHKRIFAVRSYFIKERPDWVIAYLDTPCLVASATRILGCKFNLIVSERNTTQHIGMNEYVRFNLFRFADYIVPNAHSQERFLVNRFPWMRRKLKTIVNFVDVDYFNVQRRARKKYPEVVVVASIWPSKNTLGFIEAVKILVDRGVGFHVSWYGKSEKHLHYFEQAQSLVDLYGLSEVVSLKDKTKQIKEVYQSADFFCLPSFYEGTPNVLCEALSCGLPIACSDVCDNSYYVQQGENGVLFDPKSPLDIADALERMINITDTEYSAFSQKSRAIAESKLSPRVFIDNYIKLLRWPSVKS